MFIKNLQNGKILRENLEIFSLAESFKFEIDWRQYGRFFPGSERFEQSFVSLNHKEPLNVELFPFHRIGIIIYFIEKDFNCQRIKFFKRFNLSARFYELKEIFGF